MVDNIHTGPARIVWGNPLTAQKKTDQNTKQPIIKDGQFVMVWSFGVAIPKAYFMANIWPHMQAEASALYGQHIPPKFSWKIKDGDGIDAQGKPFAERTGYAGNYVLNIQTEAFAPPVWKLNAAGTGYDQVLEGQLKTGDWVNCVVNIKGNKPQNASHTPGLYVNPVGIEVIGYDQPIFNGPDAQTLFGGQRHALPPGVSSTPVAPVGSVAMPGQQPQQAPAQQYAPPAAMPGQQPQYAPQPAPGGFPMPGQQPQQAPAQQYAAPAGMPGQPVTPDYGMVYNAMNAAPPVNMPGQPQQQFAPPAGPAPQQYAAPAGMPGQPQPGGFPMPGMMPGNVR